MAAILPGTGKVARQSRAGWGHVALGKVMATLIAEAQSDPSVLSKLFHRHILPSRQAALAELREGQNRGEISADANASLMIDSIFGPGRSVGVCCYSPSP
ncbi:MAG: TetR-like C-terminal domain-containing protein [Janthinobacterium lividum]